jgi:hypothetical protein
MMSARVAADAMKLAVFVLVGVTTLAMLAAVLLLVRKHAPPAAAAASTVTIAPGVEITVVDKVAPSAEMLCSKCYKAFPQSEMHVVPSFDAARGGFITAYRCNSDWKASLAETRQQAAAFHPPDKEAIENELGSLLLLFKDHGVSEERLRVLVGGKRSSEVLPILFGALEDGSIKLQP